MIAPTGNITLGILNLNGARGKKRAVEKVALIYGVDFLFVAETWIERGGSRSALPGKVVWATESVRSGGYTGHAPYGLALLAMSDNIGADELEILEEDRGEEKWWVLVRVCGVSVLFAYLPPQREEPWIQSTLEASLRMDGPSFVMGDLNARAFDFGDHASNAQGGRVKSILSEAGMDFVEPFQGRWTYLVGSHQSIPDLVFSNEEGRALVRNCRVLEDEDCGGSDHRMVITSIVVPRLVQSEEPFLCGWNRAKLAAPGPVAAYRECLGDLKLDVMERLVELDCGADVDVTEMEACIMDWIGFALREHIGRVKGRGPRTLRNGVPMSSELAQAYAVMELLRARWQAEEEDRSRREELYGHYVSGRQEVRKREDAERKTSWNEGMDLLITEPAPVLFKKMRGLRRSRAQPPSSPLRVDERSMGSHAAFFAKQVRNDMEVVLEMDEMVEVDELTILQEMADIGNHYFNDFWMKEAICRTPSGKATGASQLCAEALKVAWDIVLDPLALLFRAVLRTRKVPTSWQRALIHPLLKKGDPTLISNYRPISLTEVLRKVFEKALLSPLRRCVEPLSIEQGGFRAQRGTLDQVACLQEWTLTALYNRRPRFMAFLDIRAAYDQVDRGLLWQRMARRGVGQGLIELLQSLFDFNRSKVAVRGRQTEEFANECGLLQGSLLSPMLYSVWIDGLVERLEEVGCGEWFGGRKFQGLLYADDLVLFGSRVEDVQMALDVCTMYAQEHRFQFNVGKCAIVSSRNDASFRMYDEEVPMVEEFLYLGVPFTSVGISWERHWERMGAKAMNTASFLHSVGINGGGVDVVTALSLYKAFVRPCLEYGLPLCPKKDAKPVEKYHKAAVRKLASLSRGVSVDAVGIFGDVHGMAVRRTCLQARWISRVKDRDGTFAVFYGYSQYQRTRYRHSCFNGMGNVILNHFDQLERYRVWEAGGVRGVPIPEQVNQRTVEEKWVEEVCRRLSSAWIWKGKSREQRKRFRGLIKAAGRREARLVVLWVANMAVGPWLKCRCGEPRTKRHVEDCILGIWVALDEVVPSVLEWELERAISVFDIKQMARKVYQVIGDRPSQ